MAVLTASGITFSDATIINSKYGIFPQTSAVIFYQAAAPTGWTTEPTVHNDKALRVVSGVAAGSGGTNAFTSTFTNRSVTGNVPVSITGLSGGNTTLDTNMIPPHTHPGDGGGSTNAAGGGNARVAPTGNTGLTGNNGAHAHPISFTAANGPINTTVDFALQYISVIYCVFQ